MNAWTQFKARGDDWLAFLTLVGVAAQGQPELIPPGALKLVIFATTVATIAHKVFFANPTQAGQSPAGASK